MKKRFFALRSVFSILAAAGMICFSSCKKEQSVAEKTQNDIVGVQHKKITNISGMISSARCSFKLNLLTYIRGRKDPFRPYICNSGDGICAFKTAKPFPILVPCPNLRIPQCILIDCNDPLNYKDILVNPIPNYRNYFRGDPDPEPNIVFVPFRINSNIAVLQFYAEIQGTLNTKTLKLPASFDLPEEVAQSLGLNGNTVPAGIYPVIFDLQSKTLNAIVKIK